MSVKVNIRKATNEAGYLLSVTRSNQRGGASTWPGPKCSSKQTAIKVAEWIECNIA